MEELSQKAEPHSAFGNKVEKSNKRTDAQIHKDIDASVIHALNPRVNRSCKAIVKYYGNIHS